MNKDVLLAVDDKPDNLHVLQSLIAQHLPDCKLLTASSAKEGLAAAAENDLDGVLLDVQMPGTSGIEMCRRLKSDEKTAHAPVLLLTAHDTESKIKAEGLAAGADDFLTKPINYIELVAKIKVMLRIKRAQDELRDMNAHLDQLVNEKTQALRESMARAGAILETAVDCIITIDERGIIESINAAGERLFGYTADEAIGQNVKILMPSPYRKEHDGYLQSYLETGHRKVICIEREVIGRRKDGATFPINIMVTELELGNRRIFTGFLRDISERKQAEVALAESEERYRNIFESSMVGIYTTTPDGKILEANPVLVEMLGYASAEEMRERNLEGTGFEPSYSRTHFKETIELDGEIKGLEGEWRRADGRAIYVRENVRAIRNDAGEVVRYEGTVEDITERKRAEEVLLERNRKLLKAQEVAGIGFIDWDLETNKITMSEEVQRLFQADPEKIKTAQVLVQHIVHPEDVEFFGKELELAVQGKKKLNVDHRIRLPDGEVRWVNAQAELGFDEEGDPKSLRGCVIDITKRKRNEEALRESEEKYRSILENMEEGYYETNLEGNLTFFNDSTAEILGYPREELLGMNYREYTTPKEAAKMYRVFDQVYQTGIPATVKDYEIVRKDGENRILEASTSLLRDSTDQAVSFSGIIRDITERKRAEQTIEEWRNRYEAAVEASGQVLYDWDSGTNEVAYGGDVEGVLGYTLEDMAGGLGHWEELIHPDDREGFKSAIEHLVKTKEPAHLEYRVQKKDGEYAHMEDVGQFIQDAEGRLVRMIGLVKDITDRKQAEEEHERLMAAIDQAAEMVMITDDEGTIQYVNPAFEKITLYTQQEIIGENPRILKSGRHDDAFYNEMWDTISQGETWSGRIFNKKKDGTLYTEEATISPVRDASGEIVNYVAVKRDITEDLRLREQLRQAQKMEAIGLLAGGVAHDFNNILQGMFGFIQFAGKGLSPEDKRFKDLDEVRKGAERAAALTRQLLAFSRQQILEARDLNLNDLIDGLLKMIRRIIGEDIDLDFVSGHKLGAVHADPGQIEQILMNLCVNSRDAMPDGGRLTIETENTLINGEYVKTHTWAKPGRYVLLSVTDTGCGMDEETLKRIFDPFFTTKELGKGTGLGLSTVYGIVKQHDSMIQAYSEVGKGTIFKIYFPTVERRAKEIGNTVEDAVRGGTETILLAEDDEMAREAAVRILEEAGYTVFTAADGAEAVEVFEANAGEISLALLDVVMPKLGGQQVYDRIKKINPDMRFLFSSGYSSSAVRERLVSDKDMKLIQKPYDPDSLLRKVREGLDGN